VTPCLLSEHATPDLTLQRLTHAWYTFSAKGVSIELRLQALSSCEHCESESLAIGFAGCLRYHPRNRLLP